MRPLLRIPELHPWKRADPRRMLGLPKSVSVQHQKTVKKPRCIFFLLTGQPSLTLSPTFLTKKCRRLFCLFDACLHIPLLMFSYVSSSIRPSLSLENRARSACAPSSSLNFFQTFNLRSFETPRSSCSSFLFPPVVPRIFTCLP